MVDILLIGFGRTSFSALESLVSKGRVRGIVRDLVSATNEDEAIVRLARLANIPIFSYLSLAEIKSLIEKMQPDCVVVSSYEKVLPPSLLKLSKFINVHYSPLPRYRGQSSLTWAMINDESHAAITIHQISPEPHAGNILFQQAIPIALDDTIADLYERLNELQRQHLGETMIQFLKGYTGRRQEREWATYGCARLAEDDEIRWSDSTRAIDCFIRALTCPSTGAYTYYRSRKLFIREAIPVSEPPCYVGRIPGRIVKLSRSDGYIDVLTGDGILRIRKVQLEGGEITDAARIIPSVKDTLGLQKSELLQRIHELEQEISELKKNAE
ncbi:formyltransferase family protein [Pannus brasiliensis CCIBt3594]|uniref:Methionyl-tRNA formyltransferase n=1 Tax=Pannus brasiliensis CCIBt3594 TaxID=1427578 RepID=A0AAW9QUL8_9CHRO